jgi:maltose alpha-D-glucosyltransferase/alpha-amylase
MTPIEIFGRVEMPPIGDSSYFFTLGPHSFYWFSIEPQRAETVHPRWLGGESELPVREIKGSWQELFAEQEGGVLVEELPAYMATQRWFAGKGRRLRGVTVEEAVPIRRDRSTVFLTFVGVQYAEGTGETYLLPLAYDGGEQAYQRLRNSPEAIFLRVRSQTTGEEGVLFDAMFDERFAETLLNTIERRQRLRTGHGELVGVRTPAYRLVAGDEPVKASPMRGEQSNTSITYSDKLILKLFRRVEAGVNPDYEIGRLLTEKGFEHSPRVAGAIEYYRQREEPMTLALMHEFVRKEGDAWQYTLDSLRDFFDRALTSNAEVIAPPITAAGLLRLAEEETPAVVPEMIGAFMESARLLGQRTAELHAALSIGIEDPSFAPEAFTPYYQRALYQSMRNLTTNSFSLLAGRVNENGDAPPEASLVLRLEDEVLRRFRALVARPLTSSRIRTHGDLHLGQVLYTGNDFIITDFEGEPARSLTERRFKRPPLRDVAGLLRSFSYAVHSALLEERQSGLNEESETHARQWGRFWQAWVSSIYVNSYLEHARAAGVLSADRWEIELLLDVHVLEKAVYEVAYELNNRPNWLLVPLQGILELLQVEG